MPASSPEPCASGSRFGYCTLRGANASNAGFAIQASGAGPAAWVLLTTRGRPLLYARWLWRWIGVRIVRTLHEHALDGMQRYCQDFAPDRAASCTQCFSVRAEDSVPEVNMLKSSIQVASLVFFLTTASTQALHASYATFNLSTGYEDGAAQTTADGLPDSDYTIELPGGSTVAALVLPSDQYPIFPAGPWDLNSGASKWIGLTTEGSTGPPGDYYFVRTVLIPFDVQADQLEIVGGWTSDNATVDVAVNGVSSGIGNTGDYTSLHPFPAGAGRGLFHTGTNQVWFRVNNAPGGQPDPNNPVGLRVEAGLALAAILSRNCWNDVPLGSRFAVGAAFSSDGASYVASPFTLADGSLYNSGTAIVVAAGESCQVGPELRVGNISLDIDFGSPLSALDVHFGEHGGNVNLTINGAFFNGPNFRDCPSSLGGTNVSTIEFGPPGQSCGVLRLRGYIASLRIGGVELSIDCMDAARVAKFRRGDTNGDGEVDIADVVHLSDALFAGTPALDCPQTAEVNGDQKVDISDEIFIINFLFLGAPPPSAPGPFTCGADPDPNQAIRPCTYNHCGPRFDSTIGSIELHLSAPPLVSGPPGSNVSFEADVDLCWQRQSGTALVIDAIRGWSFGISRVGGMAISIQSATTAGTDAERAFGSKFQRSQVLSSGSSLVNAAVLELTPGRTPVQAPLQPTGIGSSCQSPERILRITLAARIPSNPGDCYQESLRFDEDLQGPGQSVPNRVAFTGRLNGAPTGGLAYRPATSPAMAVRVCADNTSSGSSVTVNAGAGVTVTFPQVSDAGYTLATPTGSGQPPPTGFQILDTQGGSSAYYTVSTTASYTGFVDICFPYTPPPGLTPAQEEQVIRLMVYEPAQNVWRDVTTRVDTATHTVCGTSHLSDFGLFISKKLPPVRDVFRRGDSNMDGKLDISDAVNILNFLFAGAEAPRCLDAADANDDGSVDISDAVRALNFLFAGGANPIPAPGPNACGSDPTNDGLGACDYPQGACGA